MNLTENYQLKKPVEPEKYDVQIFNTNADSIDQILKEHADKIDEQNEITNTNKEEVDNSISSLLTSVEEEISRAKTSETSIQNALQEEIERAAEAENTNRNDIAYEIGRATSTEESISNYISKNEPNWNDKYTKNEVDNKFSSLESNIDWKESVETYEDIAVTYPTPEDGWTVNVKDTDYTYRYSGTEWVVISANAIPKATNEVDGLLTKEDHGKYEDANSKKHTHENKSILDTITSSLIEKWNNAFSHISDTIKHITSTERTNWQTAYTHSQSSHAPSDAEKNIIVGVQKNGTDISVDSTTRKVNINVPTKVSELENDAGYKTTDTNYGVATSSKIGLVKPDNDMITVSADGTLKIPKIKMKNINTTVNLKEKFRTLMNDGTNASSFLTVIRNNASTDTTPIYGAGLGWGVHDTHTYLMGDYTSKHIFAGAGNGDKLNWYDELAFLSSNVASATKAKQDDEGNVIKDSYFMSKRGNIAAADIDTFVSRKSGCYFVNLSGASDLLTVFAPQTGSASALEIYSNYPLNTLKVRGAIDNNRYTDWKYIAFTTSNVASATRLQSTRNINGIPFNGTNDITVPPNTTTLTNEDLDTLKTPGLYCAGGSNTCTNKPAGVDAFGMEVLKSASGWYTQVLYASNNQQKTYIRWFNSGSWTAWERYATQNDISTLQSSFQDGCSKIATAITTNGVATATNTSPSVMASNINNIRSGGNVTASQMLSGRTAYAGKNLITGTIASKTTATYTPGTVNQTIAAGQYLSGTQTIKGDSNLISSNIAKGKTIFGVSGSYEGTTDSSTTLSQKDFLYYRSNKDIYTTRIPLTFVGGKYSIRLGSAPIHTDTKVYFDIISYTNGNTYCNYANISSLTSSDYSSGKYIYTTHQLSPIDYYSGNGSDLGSLALPYYYFKLSDSVGAILYSKESVSNYNAAKSLRLFRVNIDGSITLGTGVTAISAESSSFPVRTLHAYPTLNSRYSFFCIHAVSNASGVITAYNRIMYLNPNNLSISYRTLSTTTNADGTVTNNTSLSFGNDSTYFLRTSYWYSGSDNIYWIPGYIYRHKHSDYTSGGYVCPLGEGTLTLGNYTSLVDLNKVRESGVDPVYYPIARVPNEPNLFYCVSISTEYCELGEKTKKLASVFHAKKCALRDSGTYKGFVPVSDTLFAVTLK